CHFLLGAPGSSNGSALRVCGCWRDGPVVQTPGFLLAQSGRNITIQCRHSDSTKLSKFWYRQEGGGALVLMGYSYTTSTIEMEEGFPGGKFSITPESVEHSVLSISAVSARDGATYYCARGHPVQN
uniref:Ig-like domain-containing protein n=1 Tax=Xenopus tropicalis TaxID=8364 RepID=A0A6I8QYP8_XENTR